NHVTEPSDNIAIERDEPEKDSHDKPETKHDANDEARIHLEDAAEANLAPTSLVDASPLDFSADEKPCHVAATLPGEDPFARALVILSVAESTVDTVVQAAVQVVQAKSVVSQRQHVLFALELKVAKATGTVPTDVAEQSADVTSHEVDPGVLEHVDARVSSNNSVEVATPPSDTEVLAVATEATVDVENVGGADESTMRHSNLQLVKSLSSSTAANLVENSIRTGVQQAASRKELAAICPTEPKEANLAVARDTSDDTVDILVQATANKQDLVVDDTTSSAICVPALKVVPEHFVSKLVPTPRHSSVAAQVVNKIASNTPFGNDGDITNDDDFSDDISLEVAMIAKSIVMLCLYDGILHVANRVVADKTAEEQPLDEEPATVRNDGVIDGQLHACVAAPSESSPAIQLDGASFDSASPITVAETRPTPSCHHDNVKPLATADDPTVVDSASGDANENASCTQEIHSSKFDLICPVPATSNQTSQEAIATVNRILFTVVERLVNESEVLAEPTLSKPRPHVDNHNPACDQLAGFQTDKTKGGADNQITSASKNAHEEPFAYSMIAEEYDVPTNRLDSIIPSANNRNDSRQIGDNEQELQIDNSSTHTSHGNQGNQDLNEAKADQRHHSYQRPDNFTPESTNDVESYANDVGEFADKETAPEPAATAEEAQPSPAEDDGAAYGQDEEFEQTEAPDDSAGAGTAAPPTADSATVAEVVTSIGEALLDQSPSEAAAASELPAAATTAGADAVEAYANDVDEFADKETAPEPAATAEEAQPSPAEDDGAAYGQDEEFEQTEAP
ncbi:hypothetical protein DYB32_010337, partial [Aphanomyces invadans]